MADPVIADTAAKKPDEVATLPSMNGITDRQLLVDVAQKMSGLATTVKEGFETAASRDLELAARVTQLESRMITTEGRLDKSSANPSKHDLEAQAALATEIGERQALAKKVDAIGSKVDVVDAKTDAQTALLQQLVTSVKQLIAGGARVENAVVTWYSSPTGKIVRYIAYGVLAGWLAKNNIHIKGIN